MPNAFNADKCRWYQDCRNPDCENEVSITMKINGPHPDPKRIRCRCGTTNFVEQTEPIL